MLCKELSTALVCATDAAGVRTTAVAHYEYGLDAAGAVILVATRYTDAAGVVLDLAASAVTAGACPVAQPDVEYERLCDVQPDGTFTEFLCRTVVSFDSAGAPVDPVLVDYFELDKVTEYVPTGEVGPCPECLPAEAIGVATAWGA